MLIVDSLGEFQTTTIGSAAQVDGGCRYTIIEDVVDPASLGYAYGAVTEHLGWRRGDEEGTVLALAALGDPARFRALMREAIPSTDRDFRLDPRWFSLRVLATGYSRVTLEFTAATCPPRAPDAPMKPVLDAHEDAGDGMAAARFTEDYERERITPDKIRPVVDRPLDPWEIPVREVPVRRRWGR